jgi:hypothetical protein
VKKSLTVLAALLLSIVFVGLPAWAGSTLFVGTGAGIENSLGSVQIDPVVEGTPNFSIYQNSGGAIALYDRLVLLLAMPNAISTTYIDSISSAILYNRYSIYPSGVTAFSVANGSAYGSVISAFQGVMTSKSGDLYTALGLNSHANNSFNWSNLTSANLPNGSPNTDFGVTSFGLSAFSLSDSGTNLDDKGLVDIIWGNGGLPGGTFIAAFGESESSGKSGRLVPYSTPLTRGGLTSNVSETSSLLLLVVGLLVLAFWGRNRFTK